MSNGEIRAVLVEDERSVLRIFKNALASLPSCQIESFQSSREAAAFLEKTHADLLITDQVMPDLTGLELFERVRSVRPGMAFLLITGHASLDMVRAAFRLGASDVLFKPITIPEFLDSVRLALKKQHVSIEQSKLLAGARQALESLWTTHTNQPDNEQSDVLREGDLELDLKASRFLLQGKCLELTGCEHMILELLMRRRRLLVTHKEIRRHLTGLEEPKAIASENVRGHVYHLRKKIEKDPRRPPQFIRTVWGEGYILQDPLILND